MGDRILVIGAGGFVGRKLTAACAARGRNVIAVTRHELPFSEAVVAVSPDALCTPADYLPLLESTDTVVYVASATTPGSSAGRPIQELEKNIRPLLVLIEALQGCPDRRVIYLSSGGSMSPRNAEGDGSENHAMFSRSYHGAGKLAAEHFLESWCHQYSGTSVILRPSNLYGPGQAERTGFGIIPASFGKLLRMEPLHIWGDGSATRDFLYINDFIELLTRIIDNHSVHGFNILNASSGESVSLNTLLAMIERVTGQELLRTSDPDRIVDAPLVEIRADRAYKRFGWKASTPLEDGLRHTWQWFRELTA